ncbi:hypothetical protein LTR17_017447 [Elasticomyces elasticus]|nr:hypothetical protein LTR17_017447 [Elasticomyces elasticus]
MEPVLSIANRETLQRMKHADENHAAAATLLAAEKRTQELHDERHLIVRAASTAIDVDDALLGLPIKYFNDVWSGTFHPLSLPCLRITTRRADDDSTETMFDHGTMVQKRSRAKITELSTQEVWIEAFLNFIIMNHDFHSATLGGELVGAMQLFMAQIIKLFVVYQWTGAIQ